MTVDLNALLVLAVLALPIGAVAFITSKTFIFKSLREKVAKRSLWLGKLVGCPLCTSVWVWFAGMIVFHPQIFKGLDGWQQPFGYAATTFAGVALSTAVIGFMTRAISSGSAPAPVMAEGKPANRPVPVAKLTRPAETPPRPSIQTNANGYCPGTAAPGGKHINCTEVLSHYTHQLDKPAQTFKPVTTAEKPAVVRQRVMATPGGTDGEKPAVARTTKPAVARTTYRTVEDVELP